jgi:hypothetical protein
MRRAAKETRPAVKVEPRERIARPAARPAPEVLTPDFDSDHPNFEEF